MKAMLEVCTPTSIAYSGTSASITADGGVEFTAVTSLSLNGVFTGDYDNYMVTVRHVGSLDDQNPLFRMRSSGTDNTTANSYTRQFLGATGTTRVVARASDNFGVFVNSDDTLRSGGTAYLFGPYLAQPTAHRAISVQGYLSAATADIATTHNQSTSYDGITIYNSTTNFTGLLTVFGLTQ